MIVPLVCRYVFERAALPAQHPPWQLVVVASSGPTPLEHHRRSVSSVSSVGSQTKNTPGLANTSDPATVHHLQPLVMEYEGSCFCLAVLVVFSSAIAMAQGIAVAAIGQLVTWDRPPSFRSE